jgi:hypothetical protein
MESFKLWLENSVELQVAHFLEKILNKAGHLSSLDSNSQPFSNYLAKIWPESRFPQNFPQGIAGMPVSFQELPDGTRAKSLHTNGKFSGMILNIKNLPADLDALKAAVHHEAEHIFHPGTSYQPGNIIAYMSNQGEIRAHAREMAKIYAQYFPNENFDIKKAQSLLPKLNQTHRNYFQVLSNPENWKQLSQNNGNQLNPYNKIISLVQTFLPQYQST